MAIYALMSGNVVQNLIVSDDKEGTEKALNCVLLEVTNENPASVGWIYNGTKLIEPVAINDTPVTE